MTGADPATVGGTINHRQIYTVLSLSNFVIGMNAFVLTGMIEPMSGGLGVSEASVASLLTIYAITFALTSPVLVAVTGQVGRRRVVTLGVSLAAVGTLLSALSPALWGLYPARVLAAVGAGMVTPVSLAIASGLAPPDKRGQALSSVFLGITLSQVAGVPVGAWVAYTFGWRSAFVLILVLMLPCIWLLWRKVPQGLQFPPVSLGDLGRVLRDPVPVVTVAFTTLFLGGHYVVFTYLPVMLSQRMEFGRDGVALTLFLFGAGAPIGNMIGGWMSDRFGPKSSLVWICVGQAVALALTAILPFPLAVFFVFILVWSIIGWAFSPPQQVRLVTLSPALAPVLLALNAAAIYIGIALGSGLGTLVYSMAGLDLLGPVAAVILLSAVVVLLWSERAAAHR